MTPPSRSDEAEKIISVSLAPTSIEDSSDEEDYGSHGGNWIVQNEYLQGESTNWGGGTPHHLSSQNLRVNHQLIEHLWGSRFLQFRLEIARWVASESFLAFPQSDKRQRCHVDGWCIMIGVNPTLWNTLVREIQDSGSL
jgi:hypothetical protein